MATYEPWLLEAVLEGLILQRQRLEEQIARLRGALEGKTNRTGRTVGPRKRVMSAEGREKISAAQKRRWQAYHQQKTDP